jgi:hypothetical protein
LDDYEEGTWIPALVPTTSGSITTGAGTIGRYIKIGSEVFLNCYIVVASVASPVGGVYLSGLPFPIHAQGESTGTLAPNGCTGWDKPWLQVAGGSQLGVCYQNNNGVIAACAQFILANGHLTASLNYIATN